LATWDDHDFGANDDGALYGGKTRAEALFDGFWGQSALGQDHPHGGMGVHHQDAGLAVLCR
jgi:hypothetical protein